MLYDTLTRLLFRIERTRGGELILWIVYSLSAFSNRVAGKNNDKQNGFDEERVSRLSVGGQCFGSGFGKTHYFPYIPRVDILRRRWRQPVL